MKRLMITLCCMIIVCSVSCGKTENPEVVRQIRNTVSDCIRLYSDMYNDSAWINENFYSIFFADVNSYKELENIIKSNDLKFDTLDGLKIYKEVSRKDLRYIKADDSYVVRNDFLVVAILKNDSIEPLSEAKVAMQYYRLKKDAKDNNKYKILEVYPAMDKNDLIYKDAFIKHYTDFTKDEEIKRKVESLK